ncbi:hypothetical protein LTR05_000367 [Lithohypha guttulata]|uniref:Uncharacterized protein n=1 Tax=Lithohypha guttulata TaxID=1690604 RepID=A0AAN7YDS9_9EURO|nr:hypothetical protein LTR05_000367 [Lithohypha guttulata]
MKSPLPKNNRFSNFRFSQTSLRSPISPRATNFGNNHEQSLSICHSDTASSSPTARGTPDPDEKGASVGVVVIDSDNARALRTLNALPEVARSPITPWQATFYRHAASTEQETTYLKHTAYLRYARVVVTVFLLGASATLTGLNSDILAQYNRTHLSPAWHLSFWPTDLDLVPTHLSLSTGVITLFLAIVTVIIIALPSPNPRTTLKTAIFAPTCVLSTILSFTTVVYSATSSPAAIFSSFISKTLTSLVSTTGPANTVGLTVNGHGTSPKRETIQSFTCTISNTARAFNKDASLLQLPTLSDKNRFVPTGFGRICSENRASLAIVVVTLCVGAIGLVVAGCTWSIERRIERLRGERDVLASRDGKVDGADVPESLVGMPEKGRDEMV